MFTIDYESVNGGIYRSREQAGTITAARRIVREGLRGLSCYHLAFIADAETGRRVEYGSRGSNRRAGSWAWTTVVPLTRDETRARLVRMLGFEDAARALIVADAYGEHQFTRHDAYGPLHWRVRRYADGAYALDKIPG